ncbi:MAG: hypothetical protein NZM35_01740 [Chitinophagales bacterium]|nr:hypothetical protein [Chitinophagales bacterium]MDW8419301.1 hypothetical protein [Chitinophagales bacterium]
MLLTFVHWVILNTLIICVRGFQLLKFRVWISLLLFNLKFISGVCLWWIYTFYYTKTEFNDVHKFYRDALILYEAASENPKVFLHLMIADNSTAFSNPEYRYYLNRMRNWFRNFDEAPVNENRIVIRSHALLMFLSGKTYLVHVLWMCFISYLGWLLFLTPISKSATPSQNVFLLASMLMPSVLAWSSAVLKEPYLVLGMGLLINGMLSYGNSGIKLFKILSGFLLLLYVKFYVLACIAPAALAYSLFPKISKPLLVMSKYITVIAVTFFILIVMAKYSKYDLFKILANKQEHAIREAVYFEAKSIIKIKEIHGAEDVLMAAPVGLWNAFTRPYLWESKKIIVWVSAIETFFILLFSLWLLYQIYMRQHKPDNTVIFLITVSLCYFTLIGISTPVLGNLVRYRSVMLPVWISALVIWAQGFNISVSLTHAIMRVKNNV